MGGCESGCQTQGPVQILRRVSRNINLMTEVVSPKVLLEMWGTPTDLQNKVTAQLFL